MTTPKWQPSAPLGAIIFDCDGTLSSTEGIDELARLNGAGSEVEALTADAMGKSGITIQLYQQRLDLVKPTEDQVNDLGDVYYLQRAPDVDRVIQILSRHNKSLYIMSAGLYPAVARFATLLGIPEANVYAVDIDFDPDGNYVDFDHASPLVNSNGKQGLVPEILPKHANVAYIGDGLNDLAVRDFVTRFIGYGGIFYRKTIEAACEYYLTRASMLPLLPLLLTAAEVDSLSEEETAYYQQGLALLQDTVTRSSKTKQSP